jgi:predicted dehydrogenase
MWMGMKKCIAMSSFGSLKHFTKENKPLGAASRCVDCSVESSCPYSAQRIYLGALSKGHRGWPVSIITEVPDIESVTEAIRTGPYGRCVYDCDNDVVDNQVVTMQFEGGATVSFSMVAFTEQICQRQTKIFGTKGELRCNFETSNVVQFDFHQNKEIVHSVANDYGAVAGSRLKGHGGADFFAMLSFVHAVSTGDPRHILAGADESLQSHFLCFMAEKARLEGRVIDLTVEQTP